MKMSNKMEELFNAARINELLHRKEEDEKKKNCVLWILAVIGAVAAVAAAAVAAVRAAAGNSKEEQIHEENDNADRVRPSDVSAPVWPRRLRQ